MDSPLHIEYSHRLEGHFPVDDIDTDFYKSLTGVEEEYVNPETGLPDKPIPSIEQVIKVVGTTLLSSASFAASITAWLDEHRTRITISDSNGHRRIQFEGPSLDKSAESIKEMIDILAAEDTGQIGIRAVHIRS